MTSPGGTLTIDLWAQVACIWEATARKPGNVHPLQAFSDTAYVDFVVSAAAAAPCLADTPRVGVGAAVLAGVRATRRVVDSNTNLGILLLLAPLAAVPPGTDLRPGVEGVLSRLTVEDARQVYEAIRLAAPGGLGRRTDQDVSSQPTRTLREVMALAAETDLVARQYANGFREVFDEGVPALQRGWERTGTVEGGILLAYLHLLASYPDSLIARKCGRAEADEASRRARHVLDLGWPENGPGRRGLAELDEWLRECGHRRNPGTSADLVAASLFVSFCLGIMELPTRLPWSAGVIDHD